MIDLNDLLNDTYIITPMVSGQVPGATTLHYANLDREHEGYVTVTPEQLSILKYNANQIMNLK